MDPLIEPLFGDVLDGEFDCHGLLQGSSKSGYLGEASVDFADFIAETELVTVSLPLKFANSGAILHVSILSPLLIILHLVSLLTYTITILHYSFS